MTAIKETQNEVLRIRPLTNNMMVVVWTDSALNSEGEWLGEDPDLTCYDRHMIYSQAGALVGLMNADDLEKDGDLPLSILDWRSRATKRVVMSTFSAEAAAATEGLGMGLYMRALICEVYHGCRDPTEWDESVMGVKPSSTAKACMTIWPKTRAFQRTSGPRCILAPYGVECLQESAGHKTQQKCCGFRRDTNWETD